MCYKNRNIASSQNHNTVLILCPQNKMAQRHKNLALSTFLPSFHQRKSRKYNASLAASYTMPTLSTSQCWWPSAPLQLTKLKEQQAHDKGQTTPWLFGNKPLCHHEVQSIQHDHERPLRHVIFVQSECPEQSLRAFFCEMGHQRQQPYQTEWCTFYLMRYPPFCCRVRSQSQTRSSLP